MFLAISKIFFLLNHIHLYVKNAIPKFKFQKTKNSLLSKIFQYMEY